MKLAVLIPEYPGQTHIFFWRELGAMRDLGVEPAVVSTRRPNAALVSHSWAREAMASTTYLAPPSAGDLLAMGREAARRGPRGLASVAGSVARATGVDGKGRLRLVGLAAMGAKLASLARERGWSTSTRTRAPTPRTWRCSRTC